ncbi:MAG: MFS transporter [Sphingomonadales bacterium]|nr:MFS transporter [Sphingomonadales bacterium]
MLLFASVIGAFLLVGPVTKRFEKPRSASACMVFSAVVLITPFILRLAGFWPEVGDSVDRVVLRFHVHRQCRKRDRDDHRIVNDRRCGRGFEVQTGRRSEGLFYAGYFFAQKCATGLGLFISGLIISWAGLSEKTNPADVLPQVVDRLTEAYIVIALLLALVATAFFRRFPIGRDDHARRIGTLAAESGKTS